jgi:hypothetical protein
MKKLILLALLIISGLSIFAQDNYTLNDFNQENKNLTTEQPVLNPGNFSFGFNISPAISWLNVSHPELKTDGATLTGQIGFNAAYKIDKLLSVVSCINFGISGGYLIDSASIKDITDKSNFLMNLYTLEIPVLLRINTLPYDKLTYYAQAGIIPGFRLGSREFHQASSPDYDNKSASVNDLTNPLVLGYNLGFGCLFNTEKKYDVFAEINYRGSLLNVASKSGYTSAARYNPPVPSIFPGNMVFSFGVMF